MEFVEGYGSRGAAEGNAGTLRGEDSGVEVFLSGCKRARNGPRTGYIGDVTTVLLIGRHRVSKGYVIEVLLR